MQPHTRDTWIDAAYARFTLGGLGSIKVESLSRDLYASKGSFYWHFKDRQDLITAVMERWEEQATGSIIWSVEREGDPFDRLVTLYTEVGERIYERGGERTLYSEAEAEGVMDIVARVTERRIDYVTGILRELGVDQPEERAAMAVGSVIGLQQLVTGGWEPLNGEALTRAMLAMSMAPPLPPPSPESES
jgi:AcrR family transcriptional regulator